MTTTKKTTESPMMKQYRDLKAKHPDALLLFRCGDFYETYDADASIAAAILGITLTKRNSDPDSVNMAGFPHHALDTYLPKLIRAGKRVAICDQLEEPEKQKLVKRGITEIITPSQDVTVKEEPEEVDEPTENDIKALNEKHLQEIESVKNDALKKVMGIATETIKALRGELPPALATYFYESIGKLEVIKIKHANSFHPTRPEMNYLIEQAEKATKEPVKQGFHR